MRRFVVFFFFLLPGCELVFMPGCVQECDGGSAKLPALAGAL